MATQATTVVSIKMPKILKKQAKDLAESLGFALSTVINAQLRQFVIRRRLDFEAPHEMTPYLEKVIAKARKDQAGGNKNISPSFDNAKDAMLWLSKNK